MIHIESKLSTWDICFRYAKNMMKYPVDLAGVFRQLQGGAAVMTKQVSIEGKGPRGKREKGRGGNVISELRFD